MLVSRILLALHLGALTLAAAEAPRVLGPWKLERLAQAPEVRHPTVVCCAPDGRVFVAEFPAPGTRQGRIVCFHPDGKRTIYADNLLAVSGMQYLEGRLYVSQNSSFSAFRDGGDQGEALEPLLESARPSLGAAAWNEHALANFELAMDGFFYMAAGGKGLFGAKGRDGKSVTLEGGGIVRVRPDGTGLEIFSTGVRNAFDLALTTEDEIFSCDSSNQQDWTARLMHMVEGGYYGYPHDISPRQPHILWKMHDFGAGAASGAFANTEDGLPRDYRENLFLADYGKRQIFRVVAERAEGTFKAARIEEMFADMPEDFRPVGIAPSTDGRSIFICDWQQREPKNEIEAGRLWKLTFTNQVPARPKPSWHLPAALGRPFTATDAELAQALTHASKNVRLTAQRQLVKRSATNELRAALTNAAEVARWHGIWGLQALGLRAPLPTNGSANLVRQGLRAGLLEPLGYLDHGSHSIRFHAAVAMGRVGRTNHLFMLIDRLIETDFFARHAVFRAINRIGRANPDVWPEVVSALSFPHLRAGVVLALRETWDEALLAALNAFASDPAQSAAARADAVTLIAHAARKFPEWKGEWRGDLLAPAPPPKRTEDWEGTRAAWEQLGRSLADPQPEVRLAAVRAVAAIDARPLAEKLAERLGVETSTSLRAAIMEALEALREEGRLPTK